MVAALAAACLSSSSVVDAAAQPARKPATHRSHPVPLSHAAPDTTGTIRAPAPTQPAAEDLSKNEPLGVPFELPSAPRGRLRACGEQWRSKKMAGSTGTDTWREFATACLASAKDATADR